MGDFLDEGITEWISRDRIGPEARAQAYDNNVSFTESLMMRLGREPVENAVLHGDYRSFRDAVQNAVGGSEAETFEVMRLLSGMPAEGDPVAEARINELLSAGGDIPPVYEQPVTRAVPITDLPDPMEVMPVPEVPVEEVDEADILDSQDVSSDENPAPRLSPGNKGGDTQGTEPPAASSAAEEEAAIHPVVEEAVNDIEDAMEEGPAAVRDIANEFSDRALEYTYAEIFKRSRSAGTPEERQAFIEAGRTVIEVYWSRAGIPRPGITRTRR